MKKLDALVIGAGPAGLTTAYSLAKAGKSVLVIEQDPEYVGGISRTAHYKNYLFDIGGHRFFSKSKEVVDLWNEILPDDFIERPRLSRIYYRGKFFSYPLKAFEALSNLGPVPERAVPRLLRLCQAFPVKDTEDLPSMGAQPVRRAALLDLLQDLHREGVGHELRRDLGRLGGPAHQGPEPRRRYRRRLRRSLGWQQKARAVAKTLIESFRYPRRGPGMMWEACATQGEGAWRRDRHGSQAALARL